MSEKEGTPDAPRSNASASGTAGEREARARKVAEETRERPATFLAEASQLLASSLDYEKVLRTIAGLALPGLGAWCIVDVVEQADAESTMRRLAIIHPDPEKQKIARGLEKSWPPEREDPIGAPVVIRTREPEVVPRVSDGLLREAARSEKNLEDLRALGIGSFIVAPLIARDRVLGAMTFVAPEKGRQYTGHDLELAQDLAARCGLAIDNARLYRDAEQAREEAELRVQEARKQAKKAGRAREERAEGEERLRVALEAADLGFWQLDLATQDFDYVSDQCKANFGLPAKAELTYAMFHEAIVPEDRERVGETVERAIEHRTDYEAEYRITWPDGSEHWIAAFGRPIYDGEGTPVRMIGVTENITERKRTEEALQESENRLRALVTASSDVVYRMSPDWSEMRYLKGREFIADTHEPSRTWLGKYIHPDDQPQVKAAIDEAIRTKGIFQLEHRVLRVNGSRGWTFSRAIPMLDAQGEIIEWVGMASDITERKRAEEALRKSEETERFLAEASGILARSLDYGETLARIVHLAVPRLADFCMVDVVEEEGEVRRVQLAHVDPGKKEALRRQVDRYVPQLEEPEWEEHPIARAIRTGESIFVPEVTEEWLKQTARSEEHSALIRELCRNSLIVVPLTARGDVLGAITLCASESDRRLSEDDLALAEELARRAAFAVDNAQLYRAAVVANQAKTDFLAVMSHELRTPLNAIIGYVDLLLMDVPEPIPKDSKEQVERVQSSAKHLLQLIEEVLTFSRMEAGEEELQIETVELAAFTRETGELVAPLAEEKGLDFHVHTPEEPAEMKTDPGKVRQILLNLLSNAVKFTDEGKVELTADVQDGTAVFHVRDTGIGIPSENLKRIFDPFWQVEQGATRRKGGTGLGLSVSGRLARLLGGDVTAESAPGEGSTFTVRLPLSDVPTSGQRTDQATSSWHDPESANRRTR